MKITSAELVISAAAPKQFPPTKVPEVAFVGRSNVGKSTLINSLLNRKSLVKTSSTPGKTQLINFFRINNSFHCVDLPGYGFAKVPEPIRRSWRALTEAYLSEREPLRGVVLIIDSRHGPTAEDVQLKQWLDASQRPVLVVANKVDKLKRNDLAKQSRIIQQKLGLEQQPIPHSSLQKVGRHQIWGALRPWIS